MQAAGLAGMRMVTSSLLRIETAKIRTMVRVVEARLAQDPLTKVVVAVNYTATLKGCTQISCHLHPCILGRSVTDMGSQNVDSVLFMKSFDSCHHQHTPRGYNNNEKETCRN
jgi:hypothetical protein